MFSSTSLRIFRIILLIPMLLLYSPVFSMEDVSRSIPDSKAMLDEISFVKTTLNEYGFVPEQEGIVVYRGDSRSPEELMQAGGFFRKAFGDISKIPSFRVDGGVRHMIGLSRDITVAMGFARYNVNVQKKEENPNKEGWVYVTYLEPGLYYDPVNYPYAFLADWGREVDAIYVPKEHIIGAIKVSTEDPLCIHCYLTRIAQDLHGIRGCSTPYVDNFILDVHNLWINPSLSPMVSKKQSTPFIEQLTRIYEIGKYSVVLNSEDSEEAQRIASNYRNYFEMCKPYPYPDKELTAILFPRVDIHYLPEIL